MHVVGPGVRRALVLGFLGGLTLANAGCLAAVLGTAAAGGAVGYAYYRGDVSRDFPASFEATWAATQLAVADERLPVGQQQAHIDTGEIVGKSPKGDDVTISLAPMSENNSQTRVHVRVGYFGDRELSERLLDRIAARLPQVAINPVSPSIVNNPGYGAARVVPVPVTNGVVPAGFQQTGPPPVVTPAETAAPPVAGNVSSGKKG
jgi:hypothetical protein